MSPGIVRFYFDSKAAMLVASLQFLAGEFEERVLVPVARLRADPTAALDLLIDLYLDPEIASPRKVSVWYSFWGEASSRQEYLDICGQKDQNFAALVHDLIERLAAQAPQPAPDPDAVALGLIGSLEMLWQQFAFQEESAIDRQAAKRRCRAYLRSVFPGRFPALELAGAPPAPRPDAAWVDADARRFRAELQLLRGEWQMIGRAAELAAEGDFLAVPIAAERVIAVRCAEGAVRVLRNCCPRLPHPLVEASRGWADEWRCDIHGLRFARDGSGLGAADAPELSRLQCLLLHGVILCRGGSTTATADPGVWQELAGREELLPQGRPMEWPVAADWKVLVAQWLASAPAATPLCSLVAPDGRQSGIGWSVDPAGAGDGGGARTRRRLKPPLPPLRWRFLAPNHLLEVRAAGLTVLQAVPVAPGRSLLRRWQFAAQGADRPTRVGDYLAQRATCPGRAAGRALAASAQQVAAQCAYPLTADRAPASAWFRAWLEARLAI